jgi:hypothetical protein
MQSGAHSGAIFCAENRPAEAETSIEAGPSRKTRCVTISMSALHRILLQNSERDHRRATVF